VVVAVVVTVDLAVGVGVSACLCHCLRVCLGVPIYYDDVKPGSLAFAAP
jgi:hypothetical protein